MELKERDYCDISGGEGRGAVGAKSWRKGLGGDINESVLRENRVCPIIKKKGRLRSKESKGNVLNTGKGRGSFKRKERRKKGKEMTG